MANTYSDYEAEVTVRVQPIRRQLGGQPSPFAGREATIKLRVQVEGDDLEASTRAIAHAVAGAKQGIEKVLDPGRGSAQVLN